MTHASADRGHQVVINECLHWSNGKSDEVEKDQCRNICVAPTAATNPMVKVCPEEFCDDTDLVTNLVTKQKARLKQAF